MRYCEGFPGGSVVKNLPAVQEMRVWSLGWEDPLEQGMAAHSSTLAWRIPWTEQLGGLQSMGSQRVGHDWACTYTRTVTVRGATLIKIQKHGSEVSQLSWENVVCSSDTRHPLFLSRVPNRSTEAACFRNPEESYLIGTPDNQERCLPNYKFHEVPTPASNLLLSPCWPLSRNWHSWHPALGLWSMEVKSLLALGSDNLCDI